MARIIIMGVAGCGKSSLGQALAEALDLPFIEGDSYHSTANVAKMKSGTPLTDADRKGWLQLLAQALSDAPEGVLLSCSALKKTYRELLRNGNAGLRFVFLDISRELSLQRVAERGDKHLFPVSLVDSQFAALESPVGEPGVLRVAAALTPDEQKGRVLAWLAEQGVKR